MQSTSDKEDAKRSEDHVENEGYYDEHTQPCRTALAAEESDRAPVSDH